MKAIVKLLGIGALCLSTFTMSLKAQESFAEIRAIEDSLITLASCAVGDSIVQNRLQCSYQMIPLLIKALKTENSYEYPFDSLGKIISILRSPDKKFRIFSWETLLPDGFNYRHFGAIQMRSDTLILIPLIDHAPLLKNPTDTHFCSPVWFGATYYNIVIKRKWFRKYYFLFGLNWNNMRSNKKVVEPMRVFKKRDSAWACFGYPLFFFPDSNKRVKRFILEYKKDAFVTLNYNEDLKRIVYDYLVPLNPLLEGRREFYVPEGTYDGFVWKHNKWVHITYALKPKKPVVPPGTKGREPIKPKKHFNQNDVISPKQKTD